MSNQIPGDPMTELALAAVSIHELYQSFVDSGFATDQALYLVGIALRESLRHTPGSGGD